MQNKQQDNFVAARLFPGEDVYEQLKNICFDNNIESAVVLSGIGQIKEVELGFFKEKGNYANEDFNEDHELLNLSGTVLRQNGSFEFHLHSVISDENKNVFGGHLIKAKVSVTLEIVIMKIPVLFKREIEQETGLKGMIIE